MTVLYGSHVIGSWSIYQGVFWIVMALIMRASAMTLVELERRIAMAFMKAMERSDITVKSAAADCGMDESTFRKALRGEAYRHLTLAHAVALGPLFMVHLSAELMWLTAKERAEDILETVNVRRNA